MRSNDDIDDLVHKDSTYLLHPWADLNQINTASSLIISQAEGMYIYDNHGNRYLDGTAGMWCVNLGYRVKALADCMHEQTMCMPYCSPFGAMSNIPACILAETLAKMAPHSLNRVHFTNSGSTAVDSALRFVQYYFNATGKPHKKHIISRIDAYHGSTYLAASVSGKCRDKSYFNYEKNFVHHISSPNCYRYCQGITISEFCDQLVVELEDKILTIGPDNVACFIAEPILASGGVIIPPPGYHQRTLAVCRQYNVLYLSDEVVTGFGRLGHFFSSEPHFDIVPDILITAKGLTSGYQPLGAIIIDDALISAISHQPTLNNNFFTNGYTYSGHPIACSVALKTIELMQEKKICEYVRSIGPYFIKQLQTLLQYPIVGDVRGDHLMACIEYNVSSRITEPTDTDTAIAQKVDHYCQQYGLLVRSIQNLCILSPPLIIDKEKIDQLIAIMHRAIKAVQCEFNKK